MSISINRTKIFIAFPVMFITILMIAAYYIPFDSVFNDAEMKIRDFRPTDLTIKEERAVSRKRNVEGPFEFVHAGAGSGAAADSAPENIDYNLSLIVISGDSKMAVMRGMPVREGDNIDGMKIAKIETNRILLKNNDAVWVYLKEGQ
jgi:hypothetical protein